MICEILFFFFKQKTAYEMRISDWSSDVCSSDLWSNCNGLTIVRLAMRAPSSRTTFSARINAAPILLLGCSLNPRKAPSKKRRTLQGNGMTSICHAPRRASFTIDTNNFDSGRSAGDRGVADMEITIEELRFEMNSEEHTSELQ